MRKLGVFFNDTMAGVLIEYNPGSGYSFQYLDDYLDSSFPPISVNLPKREEAYTAEHLFPFFTNMLPEGGNRRVICRARKIDEEDFFGLLTAMADKDFIGAVNVKKL